MSASNSDSFVAPYVCSWSGCDKAYKRSDHLDRHERTHLGEAPYRCYICGRRYVRSDVLNRHVVQQHGADGSAVGRPKPTTCLACLQSKRVCDGKPPQPCSYCRSRTVSCRYTPVPLETPPIAAVDLPSVLPNDPPVELTNEWLDQFMAFATGQGATDESSSIQQSMYQPPAPDPTLNTTDWGMFDIFDDTNVFLPIGTHAVPSPAPVEGPASTGNMTHTSDKDEALVAAVSAVEYDGVAPLREQEAKTASPWLEGGDEQPMLHLPPSPTHSLHTLTDSHAIKPSTRQAMYTLSMHAHSEIWPAPDLGNFPSEETLTSCAYLYLARFAAWCPILDSPRGSFLIDKAAPILLKAVAAVGSVYGKDALQELGLPLAELIRRDIVFLCQHNPALSTELGLVQAYLLQSTFGSFSGSPRLVRQAGISRAELVSASRQMQLLKAERGEGDERAIKQDHRRRRLGWSIFLYDVRMATFFDYNCIMPWSDIDGPMPTVNPDAPASRPLQRILADMLSGQPLPNGLDDIGYSCISHALYRVGLEVSATAGLLPTTSNMPSILSALDACGTVLDRNKYAPPSALAVECLAMAYHGHIRFSNPRLLELVKTAAGRHGSGQDCLVARQALVDIFRSDQVLQRVILVYSAMLLCLLGRYVSDTPPEAALIFDAALCLWAVIRFGQTSGGEPTVFISWSMSAAVANYISTGQGTISIQGIGAVSSSTHILQAVANRLDMLSWGIAAAYKRVLLHLASNEGMDQTF